MIAGGVDDLSADRLDLANQVERITEALSDASVRVVRAPART